MVRRIFSFICKIFFLISSCYVPICYGVTCADYQRGSCLNYLIPFSITLAPNKALVANYSFNNVKIIFCYVDTTQNAGQIRWVYNGVTQVNTLPIQLNNDPKFGGYPQYFADFNGNIGISNNTNASFTVNCIYAF